MNKQDLMVLALAGVAVYIVYKATQGGGFKIGGVTLGNSAAGVGGAGGWVDEIFNSNGTPYDNGWRYFEDGTAIDPSGNYYHKGQLVWSPAK